ncbi:hypothetical protein GCM10010387_13780 [Streptomyces inusitatus]|uniref:Uncharacterized protein n=1 Tax=Streptomyces inusitatus TaxID=68221 RepID=A0A918PUP4_9ACTN|nr:hypothetical protein [Streptomyces inusitatus]GGZ21895.1 hypothetical protein GCM10010387_13780 [Streptomyces inusitatus]
MRGGARIAVWGVLLAEISLLVALAAGARPPYGVVLAAEVLVVAAVGWRAAVFGRRYAAERRAGAGRRAAWAGTVRALVPLVPRRLIAHEVRAVGSIGLWVLGRRHGVGRGAYAAGYTGPQTAVMWSMIGVALVETVVLAVVLPWPLAHRVMLVVDVYGVLMVTGLHAACVTRPHVVEPDGSLRIRYGALFELRVAAGEITGVRVDRRFPVGKLVQAREDGSLELIVGGQTTVAVELAGPLAYTRPLGGRGTARTVRFHADDPQALVAAVRRAQAQA